MSRILEAIIGLKPTESPPPIEPKIEPIAWFGLLAFPTTLWNSLKGFAVAKFLSFLPKPPKASFWIGPPTANRFLRPIFSFNPILCLPLPLTFFAVTPKKFL